jgi:hypothetical protein
MTHENEAMAHQPTYLEEHAKGGRSGRNPISGHLSLAPRRDPYPHLGRNDGSAYLPRLGQVSSEPEIGSSTAAVATIDWANPSTAIGGFWLTELIMNMLIAYKWTTVWVSLCSIAVLWVHGELHWLLSL